MPRYRIEFLHTGGEVFATHDIDYDDDGAAIAGGRAINGDPPIGHCFKVWQDGRLVGHHSNAGRPPPPTP
jgi:hypothetical protein